MWILTSTAAPTTQYLPLLFPMSLLVGHLIRIRLRWWLGLLTAIVYLLWEFWVPLNYRWVHTTQTCTIIDRSCFLEDWDKFGGWRLLRQIWWILETLAQQRQWNCVCDALLVLVMHCLCLCLCLCYWNCVWCGGYHWTPLHQLLSPTFWPSSSSMTKDRQGSLIFPYHYDHHHPWKFSCLFYSYHQW